MADIIETVTLSDDAPTLEYRELIKEYIKILSSESRKVIISDAFTSRLTAAKATLSAQVALLTAKIASAGRILEIYQKRKVANSNLDSTSTDVILREMSKISSANFGEVVSDALKSVNDMSKTLVSENTRLISEVSRCDDMAALTRRDIDTLSLRKSRLEQAILRLTIFQEEVSNAGTL